MTQLEAERLGSAIGRAPNTRQRYMPAEEGAYSYDTPCPFLVEGECSVYEHRPFACRKHHSLDIGALFCRLDLPPEFAVSAPRVSPNTAPLSERTTTEGFSPSRTRRTASGRNSSSVV